MNRAPLRLALPLSLTLATLAAGACTRTRNLASDPVAGVDAGMDAGKDAGGEPLDAAVPLIDSGPRAPVLCAGGRPCECDNGIDDDDDGLIDGFDPECTGPFDQDERTFATGVPGENSDFCQDCFYDGNSGSEDGCQIHSDCRLGLTPTVPGSAECFQCEVSSECRDNCLPRTPNGCDCFGCCEVRKPDGSRLSVLLAETCTVENVDNPFLCTPCFQSRDCLNPCGTCELCPGKQRKDLPDICRGQPGDEEPMNRCDDGERVCSETVPCPPEYYCQLGCCVFVPQ